MFDHKLFVPYLNCSEKSRSAIVDFLEKVAKSPAKKAEALWLQLMPCGSCLMIFGPVGSCTLWCTRETWMVQYHKPPVYPVRHIEDEAPENLAKYLCGD